MPSQSPFSTLDAPDTLVPVRFDDADLMLPLGMNLAAALLAAGIDTFRLTPTSGAPRAPFCMMGACFDCLVAIDGVTRQACQQDVSEGMIITRPAGQTSDG